MEREVVFQFRYSFIIIPRKLNTFTCSISTSISTSILSLESVYIVCEKPFSSIYLHLESSFNLSHSLI